MASQDRMLSLDHIKFWLWGTLFGVNSGVWLVPCVRLRPTKNPTHSMIFFLVIMIPVFINNAIVGVLMVEMGKEAAKLQGRCARCQGYLNVGESLFI